MVAKLMEMVDDHAKAIPRGMDKMRTLPYLRNARIRVEAWLRQNQGRLRWVGGSQSVAPLALKPSSAYQQFLEFRSPKHGQRRSVEPDKTVPRVDIVAKPRAILVAHMNRQDVAAALLSVVSRLEDLIPAAMKIRHAMVTRMNEADVPPRNGRSKVLVPLNDSLRRSRDDE